MKKSNTSSEAYKKAEKSFAVNEELIIEYIRKNGGATCDEAEVALGMSHQTASSRFSDLKRRGVLETTTRRRTRSDSFAFVHVLSSNI